MWYIFQILLAGFLVLLALFLSWFVVWRLILSKLAWFQEIFGIRSARAVEIAALKKKKKQQSNTFILTRSGEQAAKSRETLKAQAIARAALQATRGNMPTTTPLSGSFVQTPNTTTPGIGLLTHSGESTPVMNFPRQRHRPSTSGSFSADSPMTLSATTPSTNFSSQTPHPPSSFPNSHSHSAVPTSNSEAAALVAEALNRRHQNSSGPMGSAVAETPIGHTTNLSQNANPSYSGTTITNTASTNNSNISHPPTPASIGGTGWLQRAAIIEDYQPNK